ncbi:hypothetical protein PRIC1_004718 [Phytophthora ramorum]|uniref:Uncharacterized protein n=1 Tax=Phytophthora ramorum TaxID=164328 RepID=H3GDH8_PHYRM
MASILLRRLLPLLLLLLPLVSGQQCAHFSHDDLLSRLESRVSQCLGPSASASALSTLTERFVANEFDRRQPLALVLFSNSSDLLHATAGSVASSLFGASRSPHTVQSVDFQALLEPSRVSNYDIKQRLRSALATPLRTCPERSLFVLDNVQALDDAALPVLDVFLDPLNGKRAQFQQYVESQASRVFDCTNSVFLFLYKVTASHSPLDGSDNGSGSSNNNWREFLMQQWTRSEGTMEEFTPQAFVGRLTDAVAVFPPESDGSDASYEKFKKSREWRQMCEMQGYDEGEAGDAKDSDLEAAGGLPQMVTAGAVAFLAVPGLLLVLIRAKRWNQEGTAKRLEHGAIHRRSSGASSSSSNKRKKRRYRK